MESIVTDLSTNRAHLSRWLRWPENIGIEIRDLRIGPSISVKGMLMWVEGLASAESLARDILTPLSRYAGDPTPSDLSHEIATHRQRLTRALSDVIDEVLAGNTALLVEGWDQALILETITLPHNHAGQLSFNPNDDLFGRDLISNIALVRKRLRDPRLLALPVVTVRRRSGGVALLYMEGKADTAVVRAVRLWVRKHAGEEAAGRGLPPRARAAVGLVPTMGTLRWPDKAAMLLDAGYVIVLIDRIQYAYTAPETAASWLTSPGDFELPYPLKRCLAASRMLFILIALLTPGAVVALMNYHQEMVPSSFLLAVASARENAPFGMFFEVLALELLIETLREAAFRLPIAIPVGTSLVCTVLITMLLVLTGFVGPLVALAAVSGAVVSLALPSYGATFLVRTWRYFFLVAGVVFGFFGMAAVMAALLTYLCQVRRWGVPFFGPSAWEFTTPEGASSRPTAPGRGKRSVSSHTVVR